MQRYVYQILVSVLVLLSYSCKKDKPEVADKKLPPVSIAKVLLVCEGSLGNGNASLDVYDLKSDSVYADVFSVSNHQSLGDVLQSVCRINGNYFLTVNNSDRINVIDTGKYQQRAVINVPKPRYLLHYAPGKAVVGELFRDRLAVLDLQNYSVLQELKMPYRNVEGMLRKGGFIWTACWDEQCKYLYLLDTQKLVVSDSLLLPRFAPHTLAEDKSGNVWVLAGNVYKGVPASLVCFDGARKIIRSFNFPEGVDPIKLCFNKERDTLYFLEVDYNGGTANSGVFKMGIDQSALPDKAFIACQTNQYFWALGVHPISGEIYVGDPKGFVQKSAVSVYSPDGTLHKRFSCGVGISSFYFQ
jgi:hypothetical protein